VQLSNGDWCARIVASEGNHFTVREGAKHTVQFGQLPPCEREAEWRKVIKLMRKCVGSYEELVDNDLVWSTTTILAGSGP
jgi:hypothetical protein